MAEELFIQTDASKAEKYDALLPQLKALVDGEEDLIANLANISAALREVFAWWWVGFYWVKGDELVLGPFQGPTACTRIRFGKGVCGTAWKEQKSLLVPDVNTFAGHIACSSSSVAEIVLPIVDANKAVVGVLDVDSEKYDTLDETDVHYLDLICQLISTKL